MLFESRSLEPTNLSNYQPLLDAGFLRCFYLDELHEATNAPLGLSILSLLGQSETQAPATARELIVRARQEIEDEPLRQDLVDLIETVIIYKLPRLSREEIQAMLKIHDIRESRIYQEAKEEGAEEERQRIIQEKLSYITTLADWKMPTTDIAKLLGLDEDLVLKTIGKSN